MPTTRPNWNNEFNYIGRRHKFGTDSVQTFRTRCWGVELNMANIFQLNGLINSVLLNEKFHRSRILGHVLGIINSGLISGVQPSGKL